MPPAEGSEDEIYVPILPSQARALFRSGLTVCAAGISDVNARLGAFAEGVRYALSIPDLRFNSYLSPHDSGFNLHYDVKPIFLIQLAGQKRWWYGDGPIEPMPEVYSSSWRQKPSLDSLEHCVLEPGDVLYLPAFTWHRARADGFSLGVTLGTKGVHNLPVRKALECSPFFGEWPLGELEPPIHPAQAGSAEVPAAARAYLEKQLAGLRDYVEDLSVERLWNLWQEEVQVAKGPVPEAREGEIFRDLVLQPSNRFPVSVLQDPASGRMAVCRAGLKTVHEPAAGPFLRWLLTVKDPFEVRVATRRGTELGLARAEVKKVLRELVRIGALETAEG